MHDKLNRGLAVYEKQGHSHKPSVSYEIEEANKNEIKQFIEQN